MLVFVALNPDFGVWEEVGTVEVVPVDVRHDEVCHLFRPHTRARDGSARLDVIRRLPSLNEVRAMKARVEKHIPAIRTSDQPDHHGDIEATTRVGAGDEARDTESR